MKDQLMCNHLVVGIRDVTLSECLQLESDLTFDKATKLIRQQEALSTARNFTKILNQR